LSEKITPVKNDSNIVPGIIGLIVTIFLVAIMIPLVGFLLGIESLFRLVGDSPAFTLVLYNTNRLSLTGDAIMYYFLISLLIVAFFVTGLPKSK